jgi:hypothetical protein
MNAIQKVEETKCANRIGQEMADREAQVKALLQDPTSDDNSDFALSIETDKITTVCLSWGGPSDYLEIVWFGNDFKWEIKSVTYRFSDWFDTATLPVEEGSALWQYAEYIIECGEI